jgi:hypothetical protein
MEETSILVEDFKHLWYDAFIDCYRSTLFSGLKKEETAVNTDVASISVTYNNKHFAICQEKLRRHRSEHLKSDKYYGHYSTESLQDFSAHREDGEWVL